MASKFINVEGLTTFKQETDKTYVKQEEGKGLIETTEVARLKAMEDGAQVNKIEEVDINGTNVPIVGKKVNITADVLAPDLVEYAKTEDVNTKLADYTKTSELAESEELTGKFLDKETAGTTYLTQQDATDTYAKKEDLGKIQIPTCTKSELEDKKETAQSGDRYTVSDDGYHIYIFDQGEFRDTGTHVDLKDYAKTADVESTYVKTADLQAATAEEIQAIFQGE